MSCCGNQYCQFEFPPGPPLLDLPVSHLKARYLFLPYGTLLQEGEVARIWTEGGQTAPVRIAHKWPVDFSQLPPRIQADTPPTWAQVALDSGQEEETLIHWAAHPLHNPDAPACVVAFEHLLPPPPSWKERFHRWLYRLRNL